MITEDYVSFEVAKLLKEKGFNYPCRVVYSPKGIVKHYLKEEVYTHHLKGHKKLCPTLQMAMKWLREVYDIHIVVRPYTDKEGQCWSFIFDKYAYSCWQELGIYITDSWDTYEEACEAAIKYCLENLI